MHQAIRFFCSLYVTRFVHLIRVTKRRTAWIDSRSSPNIGSGRLRHTTVSYTTKRHSPRSLPRFLHHLYPYADPLLRGPSDSYSGTCDLTIPCDSGESTSYVHSPFFLHRPRISGKVYGRSIHPAQRFCRALYSPNCVILIPHEIGCCDVDPGGQRFWKMRKFAR